MHGHAQQLGLGVGFRLALGSAHATHGGELFGKRAGLDLDFPGLAVAHQAKRHGVAGFFEPKFALELFGRFHAVAIDFGDDVGQLEVGVFRRAAGDKLPNDHAILDADGQVAVVGILTQRGDAHAEPGAGHFTVLDQHVGNALGQIHRNGKPDAGVHAADERVDADHLAVNVDQRAAAVAGVDAGISLDKILVEHHLIREHPPPLGAHVADGDAVIQLVRRADRDGELADLGLVRVTHLRGSQPGGIDLHHGDVRLAIHAEHLAVVLLAALKNDLHLFGILNHVTVGEDDAVLAVNQPGALPVKDRPPRA